MASSERDLGPLVSTTPAATPDNSISLKGEYVTLEGLRREHIPSLHNSLRLWENGYLLDYLALEIPQSEDHLWEILDRTSKEHQLIFYAIKADPKRVSPSPETEAASTMSGHTEVLGIIAYLNVVPQFRTLEVGAVLFSPALARSTTATEAHYLLLRNVLDEKSPGLGGHSPPYRRVEWKCNHLNLKSRRAAERLGYVFEGTWRNHWIVKGRSRDSDFLSIIDDDWALVKMALEQWLRRENFDEDGRQIRAIDDIRAALK